MSKDLDAFRREVREWLKVNFPATLEGLDLGFEVDVDLTAEQVNDLDLWRQRLAGMGWGAPTWPTQYGGAGISQTLARIIDEELVERGAFNLFPVSRVWA